MKIVAGLIRPTSGEIFVDGKNVGVYIKSIVFYMPDVNHYIIEIHRL
jgi:ABC-2 type transport system ATP-binding protein